MAGPALTIYDDPVAFNHRAEPFLLANEAANSLPLGLINAMLTGGVSDAAPPFLATVEVGFQVIAAFVRTPPYRLIIGEGVDPAALPPVVAHLAATTPDLTGVTGAVPLATEFATQWTAATRIPHRAAHQLRLYTVNQVMTPPRPAGWLRVATPDDRKLVTDWFLAFHAEVHVDQATTRQEMATVVDHRLALPEAAIWLWEDDEQPVTLVGTTGATLNSRRIGPVYTPPAHRRLGYASAATAAVSQRLLDRGLQYVVLFTDQANTTANHIYQAIGYRPVAERVDIDFQPEAGPGK